MAKMDNNFNLLVYLIGCLKLVIAVDYSGQNLPQVPTGISPSETVVDLWSNQLRSLDGRLDHLTSLEYLNLNHNLFTTFPNITAFAGTLKGLYLGLNPITSVNSSDFDGLHVLEELDLQENGMTLFPNISAVGGTLKQLTLHSNLFTSAPDSILENMVALNEVNLQNTPMEVFPNLTASAGTLTTLIINSLSITHWDLSGYPELAVLDYVSMNSNGLSEFPILSPALNQVQTLHLEQNGMSRVDPAVLGSFSRLTELRLSNNLFTSVPDLRPLTTLTRLDLNINLIVHVDPVLLSSMASLQTLHIQGNKLTTIPNMAPAMNSLTYLTLDGNAISEVDLSLLNPLVVLQKFHMSGTLLRSFPDLNPISNTLSQIEIADTPMTSICQSRLNPLTNLRYLHLPNNKIMHFPNTSVLTSITVMDFSGNNIASVPKAYLQGLPNLWKLLLHGNQITVLPDMSAIDNTLTILTLDENPIREISQESFAALQGIGDVSLKLISKTVPQVCFSQDTHIELTHSNVGVCSPENHWMKEPGCSLTLTVPGLTCPGAALAYDHMTYDDLHQLNVTLPASDDGIQDQDSCSKATTRYESGQSCEGLLAVDIGMTTAPDCTRQCARTADCQTASFKPISSLLGQCMLLGSQGQSWHYGQDWQYYGITDKIC